MRLSLCSNIDSFLNNVGFSRFYCMVGFTKRWWYSYTWQCDFSLPAQGCWLTRAGFFYPFDSFCIPLILSHGLTSHGGNVPTSVGLRVTPRQQFSMRSDDWPVPWVIPSRFHDISVTIYPVFVLLCPNVFASRDTLSRVELTTIPDFISDGEFELGFGQHFWKVQPTKWHPTPKVQVAWKVQFSNAQWSGNVEPGGNVWPL